MLKLRLAPSLLALSLTVAPGLAQGAGDGPPPPAAPKASTPGDEGANRIQVIAGAELDEAFWKELLPVLPLFAEPVEKAVREQWTELETRFGFHPMKHLHSVALIGFGPVNRKTKGVALVLNGTFDLKRIEGDLAASRFLARNQVQISEEAGRKIYRWPNGQSLRFLDEKRALMLNGKEDENFFALSGEGLPTPTDLAALRNHYGLSGTEFFFNLVVTPAQRRQMSRSPGPVAALGPQLETVGVRVEEKLVKIGATFLDEQVTKQVEGMLGGLLAGLRGKVQGTLKALETRPEGYQPDFLQLLSVRTALRRGMLSRASEWVSGIELSRMGSSVILQLDREKMPFLRLSTLGWLGAVLVPGAQAARRFQALRNMAGRRGPLAPGKRPTRKPGGPFGFGRKAPGRSPLDGLKPGPIPVPGQSPGK